MRRLLFFIFIFALAALSRANTEYLGIFMTGAKIGYASSTEVEDKSYGADNRIDNYNLLNLGLLGQEMKIVIVSTTWISKSRPVRMEMKIESAGRIQQVVATFTKSAIALEIDNTGERSKKTLPLPKDAPVVDDAITAIMTDGSETGAVKAFYVLDPMTVSLVKNTVKLLGPKKLTWKDKVFDVTAVEVSEPRATTTAYFTSKGDLVKIDGPMGMEMVPMSGEEAKAVDPDSANKVPDIAAETAIVPDKPISPTSLSSLKLRVSGRDLKLVPSDHRQIISKSGESWLIDIKREIPNQATTIALSAKAHPTWLDAGVNVPAKDPSMVKLAQSIVGQEKKVIPAAERVRKYVLKIMRPNAGIGVLRDAREVLKSKEGVCRDYAILTATLLRAAKMPARLASGLVYQDGQYYYHAWAEVWDGKQWFGVDSTRPESVGVGHIKLAQGSVEDAFTFPFLGKVKMEVVDARKQRTE